MKDKTKPTQFLEIGDLMARWNVSRQTIERWVRADPNFPPPFRFSDSRVRKFKESNVEAFERLAPTKREAQG
jgi:predicted DNA-binding transcriptional regulator AlpA